MTQKRLFGIMCILTSFLLVACEKIKPGDKPLPEPVPDGLEWLEFGATDTTATKGLNFDWQPGDQIDVYSFRDGEITYKYTTTITNSSGNTCKMKALVDKQATGYYAVYPTGGCSYDVGYGMPYGHHPLLSQYNIKWEGSSDFRAVSIMDCWARKGARDFYFRQCLSLIQVHNFIGTVNGQITKDVHCPADRSVRTNNITLIGNQYYYIPISSETGYVDITYTTSHYTREAKNLPIYPGKCWQIQYTID